MAKNGFFTTPYFLIARTTWKVGLLALHDFNIYFYYYYSVLTRASLFALVVSIYYGSGGLRELFITKLKSLFKLGFTN